MILIKRKMKYLIGVLADIITFHDLISFPAKGISQNNIVLCDRINIVNRKLVFIFIPHYRTVAMLDHLLALIFLHKIFRCSDLQRSTVLTTIPRVVEV